MKWISVWLVFFSCNLRATESLVSRMLIAWPRALRSNFLAAQEQQIWQRVSPQVWQPIRTWDSCYNAGAGRIGFLEASSSPNLWQFLLPLCGQRQRFLWLQAQDFVPPQGLIEALEFQWLENFLDKPFRIFSADLGIHFQRQAQSLRLHFADPFDAVKIECEWTAQEQICRFFSGGRRQSFRRQQQEQDSELYWYNADLVSRGVFWQHFDEATETHYLNRIDFALSRIGIWLQ